MVGHVPFNVPKRYEIKKKIGFGAQGHVASAKDNIRNENVAIKKFLKGFSSDPNAKRTYREIYLMKHLKHKNIISMLDLFTPDTDAASLEEIYVVMDLARYNLAQLIKKVEGKPFDHRTLQGMMYQMLCGVQYMHLSGVAHRDLKPSNIVVKFDKEGTIVECLKILDFGLARSVMDRENMVNGAMTPYVVTRYYRAPEIIVGLPYGCAVDVWSVGCIMTELILGHQAMKGTDYVDQWNKVCEVRGTPGEEYFKLLVPTVQEYCRRRVRHKRVPMEELLPDVRFEYQAAVEKELNPLVRDLIDQLLQIEEEKRIKVDQAMIHPYLSDWLNPGDLAPGHEVIKEEKIDVETFTKKEWKELSWEEIQTFVQPPLPVAAAPPEPMDD